MPKTGSKLTHIEAPIILAFTPAEAAAALRMSRTKLYMALRTGALASYQVGRSRRISQRALEAYQRELEAQSISQHFPESEAS